MPPFTSYLCRLLPPARLLSIALSTLLLVFIVGVAAYLDPARVGSALRNPAIAALLVTGTVLLAWACEREIKAAWDKRTHNGPKNPQPIGAGLIAVLVIDGIIWIALFLK